MKLYQVAAALMLSVAVNGASYAQSNLQDNKDTQRQLKQEEKANKAQAKADKAERKALNSHKVKKADKAQDKANRETEKAVTPQ